jgi:hypothetical protein
MFNVGTSSDTIHETGIGTGWDDRKNAFEIYIDGKVVAPELTTTLINDSNTPGRVLITKEAAVLSIPETPEETAIPRMIQITQAGYDNITPDPNTLYIIVG